MRLAFVALWSTVLLFGAFAPAPAQAQEGSWSPNLGPAVGAAPRTLGPAAGPVGSGPIEELTIGSLGLSAQTAHGSRAIVDIEFPPPTGPLATQGNLVRVFFSHSTGLSSGANLTMALNGHQLDRVALDDTTAEGGVFDVQIPSGILHRDAANEVEARWTLTAPNPAQASGTLAPETLLDYAVAGAPGSLATYPYSLLAGLPATTVRLGIVLPRHPDGAEIGAAMSLVAALAQAVPGRRVEPQLLPATTSDRAGEPLIVVGRSGALPLLDQLLGAAGFTIRRGKLGAPGSATPVPPASGVLATAPIPADRGARAWVVSGQTDQGIEKASRALIERPHAYPGDAAVIDGDAPVVTRHLSSMTSLLAGARVAQEQSEQRIVLGLPLARPVRGSGTLRVALLPRAKAMATATLGVFVNGHPLGPVTSGADGSRAGLVVTVPSGDLRPGLNGIALVLHDSGRGVAAPPLDLSRTRLSLPPPTPGNSLRDLPDPFLAGAGGTPMVVLANHGPGLVQAALDGAAALGSHSVLSPPLFQASPPTGPLHIGAAGLIVFGVPGGGSQLRVSGSTGARIDPPGGSSGGGWVEDVRLPGGQGPVLWVAGATPAATARAATLLGSARLGGTAVTTESSRETPGAASPVVEISLPELLTFALAILVASWLAVVAALELRRHGGWRRIGAR